MKSKMRSLVKKVRLKEMLTKENYKKSYTHIV